MGVGGGEGFGVFHRLDQRHDARIDLAHRADDFGVAFVADEQDVEAVAGVALRLGVDLGDQGAGGVDIGHLAPGRFGGDDLGDAVGGKDDGAIVRAVGQLLDEDGAHRFETFDDVRVVDDLVAHEDRGAPLGQGLLDDLDRPVDAGAKAAGGGEENGERWSLHCPGTP
jgi:hypothetical protein